MRDSDRVVALACSDLHAWPKAPIARSQELDWFDAMRRPLRELGDLQIQLGMPPIIYAGDLFDRWNPSPELINFLLDEMPRGYAVPGQHDLYYHEPSSFDRTGYGTLLRADKIVNIPNDIPVSCGQPGSYTVILYGFPWGTRPKPCPDKPHTFSTRIAVCHLGIWTKKNTHPHANPDNYIGRLRETLTTYDAAVFGDNHKGFLTFSDPDQPDTIINCGTFMRRKSDEADYKPMIGVIRASGTIEPYHLNIEHDRLLTKTDEIGSNTIIPVGILEFIEELNELNDQQISFKEALNRFMDHNGTKPAVRAAIMESLE